MIRARFYGLAKIVIFRKQKIFAFLPGDCPISAAEDSSRSFYARIFPVRRRPGQGRTLRNRTKSAPVFSEFPRQAIRIKGKRRLSRRTTSSSLGITNVCYFSGNAYNPFRTFSTFIGDVRFRLHRTGSRIDGITHARSAGPQVVRIYRQRIGYGKTERRRSM